MPALECPRREAFAQALARGASFHAAALEGAYKGKLGALRRLAKDKKVAARIAELAAVVAWGGDADLAFIFSELMRLAKKAGELGTGAGMVAARGLLAEAIRLKRDQPPTLAPPPGDDGVILPPKLTTEEWLAAFAPKA